MKIEKINARLLAKLSHQAGQSARKRSNYNFHKFSDSVQRFLNAIDPTSYIRPHCHDNPPNDETFIVLKGKGRLIIFQKEGEPDSIHELDPNEGSWGVHIPGGLYHTIVSLEKNFVFFEVKSGPYCPNSAKGFPSWAPEEDDPRSSEYLYSLKSLTL